MSYVGIVAIALAALVVLCMLLVVWSERRLRVRQEEAERLRLERWETGHAEAKDGLKVLIAEVRNEDGDAVQRLLQITCRIDGKFNWNGTDHVLSAGDPLFAELTAARKDAVNLEAFSRLYRKLSPDLLFPGWSDDFPLEERIVALDELIQAIYNITLNRYAMNRRLQEAGIGHTFAELEKLREDLVRLRYEELLEAVQDEVDVRALHAFVVQWRNKGRIELAYSSKWVETVGRHVAGVPELSLYGSARRTLQVGELRQMAADAIVGKDTVAAKFVVSYCNTLDACRKEVGDCLLGVLAILIAADRAERN